MQNTGPIQFDFRLGSQPGERLRGREALLQRSREIGLQLLGPLLLPGGLQALQKTPGLFFRRHMIQSQKAHDRHAQNQTQTQPESPPRRMERRLNQRHPAPAARGAELRRESFCAGKRSCGCNTAPAHDLRPRQARKAIRS